MTTGLFSDSCSARVSSAIASSCRPSSAVGDPETLMGRHRVGVELQRLPELRDGLHALAGVQQMPAEVGC